MLRNGTVDFTSKFSQRGEKLERVKGIFPPDKMSDSIYKKQDWAIYNEIHEAHSVYLKKRREKIAEQIAQEYFPIIEKNMNKPSILDCNEDNGFIQPRFTQYQTKRNGQSENSVIAAEAASLWFGAVFGIIYL